MEFQSTPSARRATRKLLQTSSVLHYFNPRPPRGERPLSLYQPVTYTWISIHALREESDLARVLSSRYLRISIHALREESDGSMLSKRPASSSFQSTPSARRATTRHGQSCKAHPYFNPRPPRGERLTARRMRGAGDGISIHALREESDAARAQNLVDDGKFQSTPSARRATTRWTSKAPIKRISIHALREESDPFRF